MKILSIRCPLGYYIGEILDEMIDPRKHAFAIRNPAEISFVTFPAQGKLGNMTFGSTTMISIIPVDKFTLDIPIESPIFYTFHEPDSCERLVQIYKEALKNVRDRVGGIQ